MELVTSPAGLTAAGWLTTTRTPFEQLVSFGPEGFEASARVRFIPDPAVPGQHETDAVVPDGHLSDLAQCRLALHALAPYTTTAGECWFCVWDGYSDVQLPPLTDSCAVVLPHRRYALFRGPLDDIDRFAEQLGGGQPVAPPAFVWPADRRWCFACDVDPHWAGVGAELSAVAALLAVADLDVVPARPEEPQPRYG